MVHRNRVNGTDFTTVVLHKMQILHVEKCRGQDDDLTPIESHFIKDYFVQVGVHQLRGVLAFEVLFIDLFESVASQGNQAKEV